VAPGDLLVFYAYGETEAMDADKHMFSEDGLRAAVTVRLTASAQEVLEAIVQAVNTFTGNAPQSDDFTLFVVKRYTL